MSEILGSQATIRFGPFVADLRTQELRKHGIRLRIPGQSFVVLRMLLERNGQLVTRDEFRQALWPADTFVDFEHGVNTAVNRLRDALGDSAEDPHLIETLARRGYRFIGTITAPAPESETQPQVHDSNSQPDAPAPSRPPWSKWVVPAAVGAACILAVLLINLRSRRTTESLNVTVVPFTAYAGVETTPTFSPDGSHIAFSWQVDPDSGSQGFDLYAKAIGSETLLRLTHHPSDWITSAWSPDGTQIAFHRMAGADSGIYVVPALGGPERKLVSTHPPYNVITPISWSPDGKRLAFCNHLASEPTDRMFFLSIDSLETVPVPHNPACTAEASPVFSHDGKRLAYICVHTMEWLDLYSMPVSGGPSTYIQKFNGVLDRIMWTADDTRLLASQPFGNHVQLVEVSVADGSTRMLSFAPNASWPAISSKGARLAFSTTSLNTNIWRRDLLHLDAPPVKIAPSSREQNAAQYSPDGKHIAFESTRGGDWALWMSDDDGNDLVQLSGTVPNSGNPKWSPDGRRIAFDSKAQGEDNAIFLVDVSERVPRKLNTNISKIGFPSWSHDGQWIYFQSFEAFGHHIYRCPARGGDAIVFHTDIGSVRPQESWDARYLYFASREVNHLLNKLPVAHPDSQPVTEDGPRVADRTVWAMVPGGIYFVPAGAGRSLSYFDFASRKVRHVFQLTRDFDEGLSISPDGRYVLYSQNDQESSNIMLVEPFH
jgi:Tol biopolymer transport system component/DNA-binding winged helix-turn-helix (wHTH) protein